MTSHICGLQDCETGIKDFFNSKLYIIGYVGIGIAGVMVSQDLKKKELKTHTNTNFFFFFLPVIVYWRSVFLSTDHRDDLQYGALLCHSQQQGGHLNWILDLYPSPSCGQPQKTVHPSDQMSVHHPSRDQDIDLDWYSKTSFPLWCSTQLPLPDLLLSLNISSFICCHKQSCKLYVS